MAASSVGPEGGVASPRPGAATGLVFEIHVAGVVPDTVLEELEGVRVSVLPVMTVLQGPVADQAALHGLISRLQGVGLELIEVRRLTDHYTDPEGLA